MPRPFNVLNRDGRWTIPSHYDYPADGASRLATIAAALIALRKDDVASENVADHERCSVLDPLDQTLATSKGRGTRVIVRGGGENVLADIIIGAPVPGRDQLRYVRLPGQTRTYVARTGSLSISTTFEDWIEREILQVDRDEVNGVAIRSYMFDARRDNVIDHELLVLRRQGRDVWALGGIAPGERLNTYRMNLLVTVLDDLTIVDVRPKPEGIAAALGTGVMRISPADATDLESKGFLTTEDRALLSTGGEVLIQIDSGIVFQLQFGDIVPGADRATPSSGTDRRPAAAGNRYLMISVGFDASTTGGKPPGPEVRSRIALLRARFAPWYYVVPEESFRNIRLTRKDLIAP